MNYLFNLLFKLIFNDTIDMARNAKVSGWARWPLIVILSVFIIGIIFGIGYAGVAIIKVHEDSAQLAAGFIFLLLDIVLIFSSANKVRVQIKARTGNRNTGSKK
ncbi:MAG: hypothetical protein J5659_07575 [Clostridia bacterium]|nr:hypothetical protein [Clostridia bacterium]